MIATGIIRRIDDFGRIAIPKEIRRQLKVHEGDPFEIFMTAETVITGAINVKRSGNARSLMEMRGGFTCLGAVARAWGRSGFCSVSAVTR